MKPRALHFELESLESRRLLSVAAPAADDGGADIQIHKSGLVVVTATDGNDTIFIDNVTGAPGGVFIDINLSFYSTVQIPQVKELLLNAGTGDDSITIQSGVPIPVTVNGGDGNDTVIDSNNQNDFLYGGAGDDSITNAGGGNDLLAGGSNHDTLVGGSATDTLRGGRGPDSLIGGTGSELLQGGPGDDTFQPNSDQTSVVGGGGSDSVLPARAITPFSNEAISAMANIFGAGHSTPPDPGGHSGGVLPPLFNLPLNSSLLTFSSVTGTINFSGGLSVDIDTTDPDAAGTHDGFSTGQFNSIGGISGISAPGYGWLIGFFESSTEPTDPAPPNLNFISTGTNFTNLSPQLNQTFFVGDGLTGDRTGSSQKFNIPAGATRFFLGFADGSGGKPGFYSDNVGTLTASFSVR